MNITEDLVEFVIRISASVTCAALVGWERESREKPAGLRTHMMVALGATVFTLTSFRVSAEMAAGDNVSVDPIRLIHGLIGGIGFLGAGTIIQSRGSVTGVTTAAGIWVVGAIGVVCGCGYYGLAIVTTIYALIILWFLSWLQARVVRHSPEAQDVLQSQQRHSRHS